MFPLSHNGGRSPTSVIDAPAEFLINTPRSLEYLLTDEPPGVACLVELHAGGKDIRCIAVKWQPHVFNVQIVKRLEFTTSIIRKVARHSIEQTL